MEKVKIEKVIQNLQKINQEILSNLDKDIDDLRRLNQTVMLELTENLTKHNNDFKKVCPECNGEGYGYIDKGITAVTCPKCNGTGKPAQKS